MNHEELAGHIGDNIRTWSQAMYGIVHALRLMRAVDLGNIKKVGYSMQESLNWVQSDLGFQSSIPDRDLNIGSFDLDGETETAIFGKLAASVAGTLVVSLTSLLDECLAEVLSARGHNPDGVTGGKLAQLRAHLPAEVVRENEWAMIGARELVTLRNVLVHCGGIWNDRTVKDLPQSDDESGPSPRPAVGDVLSVGFGDVLRYKRAVRTLLNEALKIAELGRS